MYPSLILLLVALIATCAPAAPIPKALPKRTFKVASRARHSASRNPALDMAHAYAKYGWEIISSDPNTGEDYLRSWAAAVSNAAPPPSASPVHAATTAEVTALPESNDSEYVGLSSIGGQTLNLDFDTGSADLWVFSKDLPAYEIGGHSAFDPTKSSTWSSYSGASWSINYGDGSGASGVVGFDTVTIGGATATHQAVEIATAVSSQFMDDTQSDGMVGLGFQTINTIKPTKQQTFFENIMDSLEQPVFTADLKNDATGTYEFGVIDQSKYTGTLSFTPVDPSAGWWQITSNSYSVGGKTTQNTGASPAIVDTGTSLILVDPAVAAAYYSSVLGSSVDADEGGYVYPCSATTPDFGVAIGDSYTATVKGADITYSKTSAGACFGAVQSNNNLGIQIYGDALIKTQFVVFNGGNLSLGMAPKA